VTNRLVLQARFLSREALRRTPAGVAVLSFQVEHRSSQREAGQPRDVAVELECVAIGDQAQMLERITPGAELEMSGFLANRSKKSRWIVFHINEFELK
jgi:primosomal replication protein N